VQRRLDFIGTNKDAALVQLVYVSAGINIINLVSEFSEDSNSSRALLRQSCKRVRAHPSRTLALTEYFLFLITTGLDAGKNIIHIDMDAQRRPETSRDFFFKKEVSQLYSKPHSSAYIVPTAVS
jgi:hypothetical protein